MTEQKISRRRGAILTPAGSQKLQAARQEAERVANFGDRYTNEELCQLTGLSLKTIAKIFNSAPVVEPECQIPVDKQTLDLCFAAFNLKLERHDYLYPDGIGTNAPLKEGQLDRQTLVPQPLLPHQFCHQDPSIDCGEAPDVSIFYGREEELTQLAQWVTVDRSRLVAILGMGGIGKTALVTKLAQQIHPNFTAIVWRSLRNAPLLSNLLPEIIQVFSHQTEIVPPTMDIFTQISRLFHYLCEQRCLLILDNAEAILPSQVDTDSGAVAPTASSLEHRYLDYVELFRRIGDSPHQSCLLLTSREKPEVIVPLEGIHLFVRTFALHGLNARESKHLFNAKGLCASRFGRTRLREIYSGNPLALNIVTTSICDLFDGDIDKFLEEEVSIFSDIRQLLDRQFDRLSPIEQTVMYWLAIEREWTSSADLHPQIVPAIPKSHLFATLESLGRKSLIEHSGGKFTQQAVVMEYMTERLIDRVFSELTNWDLYAERPQHLPLWLSFPLMAAQAPAYIQTMQKRGKLNLLKSTLSGVRVE
jgi:ABC-type dipeptide/oligopeptide/nickel transport system ATPase subunit